VNLQEFLAAIEKILVQKAKAGPITPATDLTEEGVLDSMAVLEIQALADESFGLQLEPNAIGDCRTVADLCRLVKLAVPA
jgi:acyl carrier protein